MKIDLKNKKRLVIKIGSSTLVEKGLIKRRWFKAFVSDVHWLTKQGFEIVIVSSGAIALGKKTFKSDELDIKTKQAAAAVGQIKLIHSYQEFFKRKRITVAQVLLTSQDCNERKRYLKSKSTIKTLLEHNVIPIVNENDSLGVEEIKIGDNDRLAARVSQMISADILLLLSDVDGLYDKNPNVNKDARFISEVTKITRKIEQSASKAVSSLGTGGMKTKVMAAKMLEKSGCETIIANGAKNHCLRNIFKAKENFTIFYSSKKSNINARKKWLSGFLNISGKAIVNECAKNALLTNRASLLPVGVVKIEGNFKKNDVILIEDEGKNHIATGISNYSSVDSKKIILKNSKQIKKIIGKSAKDELIHIDNLVVNYHQENQ
ncbi:MAG: glutamate 5-kinase [Rickettsiales bacterium]|nr:glutamate 5-kinase [Rickettsiales bacterium]